jgi:hypothetical protein
MNEPDTLIRVNGKPDPVNDNFKSLAPSYLIRMLTVNLWNA